MIKTEASNSELAQRSLVYVVGSHDSATTRVDVEVTIIRGKMFAPTTTYNHTLLVRGVKKSWNERRAVNLGCGITGNNSNHNHESHAYTVERTYRQ